MAGDVRAGLHCALARRAGQAPWRAETWQRGITLRRMPRMLTQPVGFAHRGGAPGPDNTLSAFRTALAGGATALETDVRLTADGVAVLVHDDPLWTAGRRFRIRRTLRARLPRTIPALPELYAECGADYELAIDVLDSAAAAVVVGAAADAGATRRLWLCHPDLTTLAQWRPLCPDVRLVLSTTRFTMRRNPRRLAARLRDAGVDAVNVRARGWTPALVAQFHRDGRLVLGWQADTAQRLRRALAAGCDGVFCNDVSLMQAVLSEAPARDPQ